MSQTSKFWSWVSNRGTNSQYDFHVQQCLKYLKMYDGHSRWVVLCVICHLQKWLPFSKIVSYFGKIMQLPAIFKDLMAYPHIYEHGITYGPILILIRYFWMYIFILWPWIYKTDLGEGEGWIEIHVISIPCYLEMILLSMPCPFQLYTVLFQRHNQGPRSRGPGHVPPLFPKHNIGSGNF